MNENHPDSTPRTAPEDTGKTVGNKPRRLVNILLSVIIIAAGVAGAAYFKKTAPRAQRRPPAPVVPLVETAVLKPATEQVRVPAMGTVVPARQMVLRSRVSGEIKRIHPDFINGGIIRQGEILAQLDDEDYRLAISRKKSDIASAEYALKLELGHQEVAKREWELLNAGKPASEEDVELALRKPHLAKARADLAAAMADLKKAELDQARTRIRAPFNAIVRDKRVEVGSQITAQDTLAELVGTDEYWLQVPVSVDRLRWIDIPSRPGDTGSPVQVTYRDGFVRTGRVIKLLGDLETEGRMARVVVSISDPLNLTGGESSSPPLLLGEYVRVEILGKQLPSVYRISRDALRDDRYVWIMTPENTLEIRPVTPIWRTLDTVLLEKGLTPGERLIVSDLPSPVPDMPITDEASPVRKGS